MSAITIDELSVDLDGVEVLHGVSCAVPAGGWLALIGPNGAGKTTLLRAVAGLVPHRGTIGVNDTDLGALRGRGRARLIAYLPQIPVLPPDMTVRDYVLLGRTPYLGYLSAPGRSDRAKADEASERLDVTRFAGRGWAACPAANASASGWPGPWPRSPGCCCLTSRPTTWTSGTSSRSSSWSTTCAGPGA